jgi:hypothetical protein
VLTSRCYAEAIVSMTKPSAGYAEAVGGPPGEPPAGAILSNQQIGHSRFF